MMISNKHKQMNLIEQSIRRIVKEEIDNFNSIELNDEVLSYARKFNSLEEFLRSGGLPIDLLDRLAFGFSDEDIKTLSPSQIKIKWKEDLENVLWEIQKSGLSKIQWAKKINLSEPVDVSFEKNNFYLEDGHHRYVAAKILKKPLNVNLEIKSSPVKKINPNISYDKLMTLIFSRSKGLNEQKTYLKEYINTDMHPLSNYYSNIGMNTEDVFDLIEFYDTYRDLYPGYNSNGENEFEEDYYYKTEEKAYNDANETLNFFNSLPNPVEIYRSIKVKSKEDIDFGYLGDSWSFDKQSAINFAKNQAGGNFLLIGKTNHSNIDWDETIKSYYQFSIGFDGYDENEIKIIDSDNVFDIRTEKIGLKINEEIEDYRGEHEAPSKEDAPIIHEWGYNI